MFQQVTEVVMVLSYYVAVKLPEEQRNGNVQPDIALPAPALHLLIVAEKDEPLCREDFRRPGVLPFEQKQYLCLARSRSPSLNRH